MIIWVTGILNTIWYIIQQAMNSLQFFFSGRLYICTNTYQNVYLFPHFMPGPRTFKNTFSRQCTVVSNMDKGIRNELKRNF